MAISKVTGGGILDNSVTDADINSSKLNGVASSANNYTHPNHSGDVVSTADGATVIQTDAVDIAMLSATGSPGSTTFLRGDNSWAAAGSTSASDLTSGTIPAARIADDAITADKLANSINSAIAANTSKTGITSSQATAITAALPKAGGTVTGNVIHNDNKKVLLGSDSDAEMYHTGSQLIIKDTSSEMKILATRVQFQNAGATENIASFNADGAVELYHNHSKKIETTAAGVTVTGRVSSTNLVIATSAPSSPAAGDMWFDSSSAITAMKVYSGAGWDQMSNKFTATGGTVTTHGIYKVHTFTSSGNFVVSSGGEVDVLIVAGGGAGGNWHAGGGGAGGSQTLNTTVSAQTYSIVVGAGGAGGTTSVGSNGANSSALGTTSLGGGRGGNYTTVGPASGGSGGGGNGTDHSDFHVGAAGTSGQGNAGGGHAVGHSHAGGGGGGKGAVGTNPTNANSPGGGGNGENNNYRTGSNIVYAGGGGGGTWGGGTSAAGGTGGGGKGSHSSNSLGSAAPTPGTANTGGGGGGFGGQGNSGGAFAASMMTGGSGIVIIRYAV